MVTLRNNIITRNLTQISYPNTSDNLIIVFGYINVVADN